LSSRKSKIWRRIGCFKAENIRSYSPVSAKVET
jgi:hypothetical protein